MTFLNKPRKAITCYCFINLKLKKILIINHKCGVSYFNHLFTKKYTGETRYIDFRNEYQLGDWHLAIVREEIQNFASQYDEREFDKIMITRNPYDRALSFFTHTFWDNAHRKPAQYIHTWGEMAGNKHKELKELREQDDLKKAFSIFLDIQWNNPTEGVKHIHTMNNGLGDEHIYPQSLAYKGLLTTMEFVDIKDSQSNHVMDFLGFSEELNPRLKNSSSNSIRVLEDGFFDDMELTAFNEFYRDDFELNSYPIIEYRLHTPTILCASP